MLQDRTEKIFFRDIHENQGTQALPLVIMHGLMGSSDNWMTLAKQFAQNRRVLVVDMPNHGKSYHAESLNYDAMTADMAEWARRIGLTEAHWLGHSMGGKVLMQIAIKHPELVSKMIVADMAPKAYPVHHKQIIEGLQAVASAKPGERQKADQILARHVSELSVRQFLLKNLIRTPEGFDWRINLPVIARDIAQVGAPTPSEKTVNKPALFIRGANSNYIQDEDIPLIKALFPNASVATVQGAGHWVHAEKPEETAQLVEDFLHGV